MTKAPLFTADDLAAYRNAVSEYAAHVEGSEDEQGYAHDYAQFILGGGDAPRDAHLCGYVAHRIREGIVAVPRPWQTAAVAS